MKKYLLLLIIVLIPCSITLAHPGRTDSSGCHTCRTNCSSWGLSTGEYHCHNAKIVPQPVEPVKSTYGANGTGYTTPAPEYKQPVNTVVKKTLPVVNTQAVQEKKSSVVTSIKVEEKKVSWFNRFVNWFK